MPARMAPFAYAEGGNVVLLSTSGSDEGAVYFWDHENEDEFPSERNLVHLAPTLEAFLDGLTRPDDDFPEPVLLAPIDEVTPELLRSDIGDIRSGEISIWFGVDQLKSPAAMYTERFPDDPRGQALEVAAREAAAILTADGGTDATAVALDTMLLTAGPSA